MKFVLEDLTSAQWHKAKKEAGIPDAGIFASSEKRNNIGPKIDKYVKARKDMGDKPSLSNGGALLKALDDLDSAITKLIGSDGVKGNREFTSPKAVELQKGLTKLRADIHSHKEMLIAHLKKPELIKHLKSEAAAERIEAWKKEGIPGL